MLAPGVPALKSAVVVSMKLRLAVVKLQVSSAPSGFPLASVTVPATVTL